MNQSPQGSGLDVPVVVNWAEFSSRSQKNEEIENTEPQTKTIDPDPLNESQKPFLERDDSID